MKLYKIARPLVDVDYDEYDAFIVAAPSEREAIEAIRLFLVPRVTNEQEKLAALHRYFPWRNVTITDITTLPKESTVLLASFNAG